MSRMTIKLDENLGRSAAEWLNSMGYEADRVHDQGFSGASDQEVWRRVCADGRFLITLDLDFSDVRQFPPGSHPGILLLRPKSNGRDAVLEVLQRVVREQPLETLAGCLAVADPIRTRIRRPNPPSDPSTTDN
jgi:predicted nuclease of predicted toxin-antitoxin system